ncbi:SitI3 family protein [Streptomyces sp. NBC_01476]|uniref:SitI3 family protein n=1 Tax=Streptomyces sp. NBC_01476 TaxID=2903881 RepID=UPI002E351EA5|nr:SitI3 family protein [Streptomyces sp. NBC_01476]
MAISHSFSIATAMPPGDVAHALKTIGGDAGLFTAAVTPESLLDPGAVSERGTWIRVVATRPQPWSPVVTDLGIMPSVRVAFVFDKEADLSGQEDDVITVVAGLLRQVPGDAVLLFHDETIWLLRRGDDLSLNERNDLWPPRRLAVVSQPYRRATHAFSEE